MEPFQKLQLNGDKNTLIFSHTCEKLRRTERAITGLLRGVGVEQRQQEVLRTVEELERKICHEYNVNIVVRAQVTLSHDVETKNL